MLLDGYWKKELISLRRQLSFWSRYKGSLIKQFAEHQINRCLLYSASIIRKIFEDEGEAERDLRGYMDENQMPPLRIFHYTLTVKKYQFIGENQFLAISSINLSDYDFQNGEEQIKTLKEICNQFIHSYVWCVLYNKQKRDIYGVMFASDKDKERLVYLLKIEDWIKAIDFVAENCNIMSKETIL